MVGVNKGDNKWQSAPGDYSVFDVEFMTTWVSQALCEAPWDSLWGDEVFLNASPLGMYCYT